MATKAKKSKPKKKAKRGGTIPLNVLEKRLARLNALVKKRGGKTPK